MLDIEKMVVAADDSQASVNNISDAISRLRQGIENGNVSVSPTGGAEVDIPESIQAEASQGTQATGAALADTQQLSASQAASPTETTQPVSTQGTTEFKPVPKAVVGADTSVADAINNMRENLVNGEVRVNPDGTVLNPGTPATQSSIANGDAFKPVPKATVAGKQWYETNPDLQRAEIVAMKDIKPDATWGYLPNGKMYWQISLRPVNAKGQARNWTLLGVYDEDHPQQRWGGSVKFYPVSPNYEEMMKLVEQSSVTPKHIPHLLRDESGQIYMCSQDRNLIQAGHNTGDVVTTAATGLRFAMRWINVFELGLIDQKTWTLFQQHGKI